MRTTTRLAFCISVGMSLLVFGCDKLKALSKGGAADASTDASLAVAADAAPATTVAADDDGGGALDSGTPAATTTAHATSAPKKHDACPASSAAFWGHAGAPTCERTCTVDTDCPPPYSCQGTGQLLNPDGGMGPAHKYCNQLGAANACPQPNAAAFYGKGGSKICEVVCNTDKDCASPKTCKGIGQLLKGDGTMGPPRRYCR